MCFVVETESRVTTHAGKRIRERFGGGKKASQTVADRALSKGLGHDELTGKLKRYIDSLWFRNRTANNIKVYSEKVFIFNGNVLITVISLPTGLKKIANKLFQNKNTEVEEIA